MKNDTAMSFSDFNKTKATMVMEKSWFYETQRQKMKRLERDAKQGGGGESKGGAEGHAYMKLLTRSIFDKARQWDMDHSEIDFKSGMNWHGSTNMTDNDDDINMGGGDRKHLGCKWRGENDEGVKFLCNNAKLVHPWRRYKDEFGAEVPEQLSYCHFHAKFCLDPNKNHGDHLVKIKEPNEFALCNECYVQKQKRPPPKLPKFRIPGVSRASRGAGGGAAKMKGAKAEADDNNGALNEQSICDWKPNRHVIAERGMCCQNTVFRSPDTKVLFRRCPWHLTECSMLHKDSDPAKKRIQIPNEDGLCVAHYVSKHGKPPVKVDLPYPGMIKRTKEVERVKTQEELLRHALAPPGEPDMDEAPAEFKPILEVKGFFNKRKQTALDRKFQANIKLVGNSNALRIQNTYRKAQCMRQARYIGIRRLALKRFRAAVKIQCIARRYIQKEEVAEIKKNTVNAVNLVIRLTRGYLARRDIRRKKAAAVLQRGGLRAVASALMYAVKSTLEVRHEHEHEEWGHATLQKYAKGFLARLRVRQHRELLRRQVWASLMLQKYYRGRIGRRRFDHLWRVRMWNHANTTVLQSYVRKVFAIRFVQNRRIAYNEAALKLQRFCHVFLAKMAVHYERKSIQMFWDWLAPTLPRKAFEMMLPRTFYGVKRFTISGNRNTMSIEEIREKMNEQRDLELATVESLVRDEKSNEDEMEAGEVFFRKYDPDAIGAISRIDFKSALQDMWDSAGCPLLFSEANSLVKRFDFHNDGWVDYHRFLRFARRHEKPCAIHGRLICADCISYGQCIRNGVVLCNKFCAQIASPNVCTCGHYVTAHEMIPEPNLDEVYVDGVISQEQMDDIFRKEKKPDFEKPARVRGMALDAELNKTRYEIEKEKKEMGVDKERKRKMTVTQFTMADILKGGKNGNKKENVALMTSEGGLKITSEEINAPPTPKPPRPPLLKLRSTQMNRQNTMKSIIEDTNDDDTHNGSSNNNNNNNNNSNNTDDPNNVLNRTRAATQEVIAAAQPHHSMLVKREKMARSILRTNSMPTRDQHWEEIKQNQYESVGHLVKSQAAPSYTESVKMIHHENEILTRKNEIFAKKEQSMSELEKGFKITTPIPLISGGELRLTTKAVDLYLFILQKLRDETLCLVDDQVAFVNFCFNYVVFMERHWRKLCKDIRNGKLDKGMPIAPSVRRSIESAMLPDPKLSRKFEEGLRRLGFHDRASGTKATAKTINDGGDLDAQAALMTKGGETDEYLEKKKFKRHVVERLKEAEIPATARERKQPIGIPPDVENKDHSSLITKTNKDKNRDARNMLGENAFERSKDDGGASSVSSIGDEDGNSSITGSLIQSDDNSSLASQYNITDTMRKMTLRDYFGKSLEHDITTDATQAQFPTRLISRGSESDLRPMSMQNLFKSAHTLKVLPRPVDEPIVAQPQRTAMGYICGHPGCGHVFSSLQAAELHQKQHKLRNRLAIPTPQIDQFLLSYWPKDIPWKKAPFNKLNTSTAPFICPIEGCIKTYPDAESVKKHMRMGHSKGELMKFMAKVNSEYSVGKGKPVVEWIGKFKLVPPFAPPPNVSVILCPHHAPCNVKCPMCLDVIRANGPVPPMKFYQSVKAVISLEESGRNNLINMTFDVNEFERSPLVREPATGKVKHTQLKALCCDAMGRNFANVSFFWTFNEVKQLGFHDFVNDAVDKDHELYMEMESNWIKLEDIVGASYTICCGRDEFKKRLLINELPSGSKNHPVCFSRTKFYRTTMKGAGERTIEKLTSSGKGDKYDKLMKEAGMW